MGMLRYENFDLSIRCEQDRYVALARCARDSAEERFTLPFSAAELGRFPLSAGTMRHLSPYSDAAPADKLTAADFGRRLYAAVFHDTVRDCLVRHLVPVRQGRRGLRLSLDLAAVPELALLPWEYLASPTPPPFALSAHTPIVRMIRCQPGMRSMRVDPPLHILLLIANSGAALAADQECEQLRAALADPIARGLVTLEFLAAPRLELLREQLRGQACDVLHFIGHGSFDVRTQQGALLLEEQVSATNLAVQLHDRPPHLIFLNACQSGVGAASDLLAGTAQRLIEYGTPAVVATQSAISDQAAITLAGEFYRAVAQGYPVDAALAEGRKALFDSGQQTEWCIPVLFSNVDDYVLLRLPEEPPPPPERPRLSDEPELVGISAGPFQMGSPDAADAAQGDWPLQEVTLPTYAIGKYPLTNAQYAAFVVATRTHKPEGVGWIGPRPPAGRENHPVTGVSWHDACAYCVWLSAQSGRRYRLPTEAEWVKAARGDRDARRYPWGATPPTLEHCNYVERSTTPVDRYPQGQSPYGCFDLLGNVYEWTATIWGDDARLVRVGVCGEPYDAQKIDAAVDAYRVCCGGPLQNGSRRLGCSVCSCFAPSTRASDLGFRVICAIGPASRQR